MSLNVVDISECETLTEKQKSIFFLECPACGNTYNYFETEYEVFDMCSCGEDRMTPVIMDEDGTPNYDGDMIDFFTEAVN